MSNHVTLNGKKHPVRFTYSVLANIEKETGKSFLQFDPDKIDVGDCIVMAYYGCRKANPDFKLSIEDVGDSFHQDSFVEIFQAFTEDMAKPMKSEKK